MKNLYHAANGETERGAMMKVGLLGAGRIGAFHAAVLAEHGRIYEALRPRVQGGKAP